LFSGACQFLSGSQTTGEIMGRADIKGSGADFMFTVFVDFRRFFGEKLALFIENQCYDRFYA
jgi:hypothetical protein